MPAATCFQPSVKVKPQWWVQDQGRLVWAAGMTDWRRTGLPAFLGKPVFAKREMTSDSDQSEERLHS